MRYTTILLALTLFSATALGEEDAHAADRRLMRAMLAHIEQALNARDFEAVLAYLDPQVLITYQNAVVTRGHAEARAYYRRMMEGAGAIVKGLTTQAQVSAPAVFHGDTAVAYGTTADHYRLAGGLDFVLAGNWSTTLQKQDGTWKVLAIHFSTNLFDNPLLNSAKRMGWIMAAGGLAAGMALMWLVARLRRRTRTA